MVACDLGPAPFVFLSLLCPPPGKVEDKIGSESQDPFSARGESLWRAGVVPLQPHFRLPVPSSQGSHKKRLGAVETLRITLYSPHTHMQPAIRACVDGSPLPTIPVNRCLQKEALAGPDPLFLGFLQSRRRGRTSSVNLLLYQPFSPVGGSLGPDPPDLLRSHPTHFSRN